MLGAITAANIESLPTLLLLLIVSFQAGVVEEKRSDGGLVGWEN